MAPVEGSPELPLLQISPRKSKYLFAVVDHSAQAMICKIECWEYSIPKVERRNLDIQAEIAFNSK